MFKLNVHDPFVNKLSRLQKLFSSSLYNKRFIDTNKNIFSTKELFAKVSNTKHIEEKYKHVIIKFTQKMQSTKLAFWFGQGILKGEVSLYH
jgi:hypothetical protein